MKYLILTASYKSVLREEFGGEFDYRRLPLDLIRRLEEWYGEYLPVVQWDTDERQRMADVVRKLDERGVQLAKEIRSQLRETKIKYFSEGLLRYIEC